MKLRAFFLIFSLICAQLFATNVATQIVTMSVEAINELAINGAAPTLTINSAVAGSLPAAAVSSGITYAYTTNSSATVTKKITGSINLAMPANLQLQIQLAAPASGGSSAGQVALTTTSQDLVTGITVPSNESGISLTYTFQQTAPVGVTAPFTRTVTLTLLDT